MFYKINCNFKNNLFNKLNIFSPLVFRKILGKGKVFETEN